MNSKGQQLTTTKKKGNPIKRLLSCWEFWLLALPAIAVILIFNYWPMFGAILAFKDFNYEAGILGSEWIGFQNFEFFFKSQYAWRITRNTMGYAVVQIILNTIASMALALLMYEVTNRKLIKTYQTIFILPSFMSWVIVSYITYILFNAEHGVMNQILAFFGQEGIKWYSEPKVWPFIIPLVALWQGIGMNSLMYYATLVGMDDSIFEAAEIDGAGRWRQVISISVPSLIPMMTILLIMSIGKIFRGDFGLFYQIPRNDINGALYPTTDIIDTYVFRAVKNGDTGISSAIGLLQSVIGLIMVVFTNWVVKKIEPDNSMF